MLGGNCRSKDQPRRSADRAGIKIAAADAEETLKKRDELGIADPNQGGQDQ